MKNRLIILSDLWGKEKSGWVENYAKHLKHHFEIKYYDCCELGEVDKSTYTQEALHKQFVNGGIERAVQKLIEKESREVNILSFSVGGSIAWKYGLKSNKLLSLCCVSSTRLRHEVIKPKGEIYLYYGAKDRYRPQQEWFDGMLLDGHLFENENHELYKNHMLARQISQDILKRK